ncbi:conserved hypothetical protein [Candidatus Desulfarcum epimagneticum]|uniref:SPOR domain-containing protein n=1 Tax=uncultured Desulfobacteraceae bacterium TaxID=218296 RepID=A0A484HLU2_9BACT|nr:conserved hypothetical protein [uncultured Desulfobacteraceae bacterium]
MAILKKKKQTTGGAGKKTGKKPPAKPRAKPRHTKPWAKPRNTKALAAYFRAFMARWLFVILASFWMFALGVFVGRGTAPFTDPAPDIGREVARAQKEAREKEYKALNIHRGGSAKKTDLTFYEDLKKSQKNVGKPLRPAVRRKKAPSVSSKPPPKPRKRFTVQVASMKNPEAAEKIAADLKRRGYSAYRTPGVVPGKGRYHRVRVGNFATRKKAGAAAKALSRKGFSAIVLMEKRD